MIVTDIDWDTDTITVTEVNVDYENCQISWVGRSPAASFSAWKATLPITLRKLKIGYSAPRQDFDVLSGHILYFPKVIRYKNTPNDAKSFGVC